MIIGSRQRLARIKNLNIPIKLNGVNIKRVNSCKHLGVVVDESLSWHDQVCNIKKKILPGLYMLRKCKGLFANKHTIPSLQKYSVTTYGLL